MPDKEKIEKDIKRCKELIKTEHANWIGISNQLAISHMLEYIEQLEQKANKYDSLVEKIKAYANWHIEALTETIADYIDDDRIKNVDIINDFKEQREHWIDVLRILNNEKTYIDYTAC